MDLAALRQRATTTYRLRRDRAMDLVDRVPILGRLVNDFVRIEFIDRCMLIAAQGLLALVPMLVVLAAFFPHLTGDAVSSFTSAAGVGKDGTTLIEGELSRIVSEDPTVVRVVSALVVGVRPLLPRRLRERGRADETAAPPAAE